MASQTRNFKGGFMKSHSSPKGHMGVKSSPFAPTDCKLISQYMIVDHMAAHYKKVLSAKSAIDSKTPKAMLSSQKVRDKERRTGMTPSPRPIASRGRPVSAASSVADRNEILANLVNEYNDDNHDIGNVKFNSSLNHKSTYGKTSGINGHVDLNTQYDTKALNSLITQHDFKPRTTQGPPSPAPNTTTSTDLINIHNNRFTEARPFQPRTLKSTRSSKLGQFKYYNPPTPRKKNPENPEIKNEKPRPVPKQRLMSRALSESADLMNESLMSRDMRGIDGGGRTPTGVPPLDISLDADHINWLKEQSVKAHARSSAGQNTASGAPRPAVRTNYQKHNEKIETYNKKEDELKYLEFIQDVTSDILDRGIFTNRVLKQVFQSHIDKRRGTLKLERMEELIRDVRQDLGIPETDQQDEDSGVGCYSSYSPDPPHGLQSRSPSPEKTLLSYHRPPKPRKVSSTTSTQNNLAPENGSLSSTQYKVSHKNESVKTDLNSKIVSNSRLNSIEEKASSDELELVSPIKPSNKSLTEELETLSLNENHGKEISSIKLKAGDITETICNKKDSQTPETDGKTDVVHNEKNDDSIFDITDVSENDF